MNQGGGGGRKYILSDFASILKADFVGSEKQRKDNKKHARK